MGEQKERMLRGDLYVAADAELEADHRRCRLLLERFNASGVAELAERAALLREMLGFVGDEVTVKPPLQLEYGYQTSIGARTFINYGAVILDVGRVTIGADVQIGPNVLFLTPTHPLDAALRRTGAEAAEPITVEDGAWLGGGVILCPGVTIGHDTVVGAGSVVARDLPPGVVAVGNPARVIRSLDGEESSTG